MKIVRALLVAFGLSALGMSEFTGAADAQQIGIILMHGKWGTPLGPIQPVELELKGAGFLVVSREMPWSDRRAYDAGFDEVMTQLDGEVAKLRAAGAAKIVIGGQSFGANIALGYGARRPDIQGVMALAPGHTPERFARIPAIAESLARAHKLIAEGKGGQYANFDDLNQGKTRQVSACPPVYVSYFDPQGPAVMPANAARLSPATALLWVVGTHDPLYTAGSGYGFDRAPRHPHSAFRTVEADHFNTPAAARRIVLDWVKGLP